MASWKIHPDPGLKIDYVPFLNSRKFFAVDDSRSTAGSILKRERAFIDDLRIEHGNPDDRVSLWGAECDKPTKDFKSTKWRSTHGGTCPAKILQNTSALNTIKKSDVWFLLTDGEIFDDYVHRLAQLAHESNTLSVPIVFLIVGSRGRTPDSTNISVGVSFFAGSQDTLILFKETETGKIFVIAGKGCFARLGDSATVPDLSKWSGIPVFANETELFKKCASMDIKVPKAECRAQFPKGVSLGGEWEKAHNGPVWVDIDALPQTGKLSDGELEDLLAEEAFNNLAVAYKTRQRVPELRTFIQLQKVEQVAPKLEDVSGAAAIISQMSDLKTSESERVVLQERLREAHTKNREHYQRIVAEFAGSAKEQSLRRRNYLVDAAMRTLAAIEAASFNAEILSRRSNRARRAEVVASDNSIAMANLDLEGPSYKGFCLVCCGEEEVMSICLKELDSDVADDNTTDFALNFPLAAGNSTKNVDLVSSQNICFQCALLGPSGMSIYKEKLKAIIPAVQYDGPNKKYINDQLYLALTASLATGAAGIAQLFMAILDKVLRTKSWAGSELEDSQMSASEQHEVLQRRDTFRWMLDQLLKNTYTRQTFTEVGEWVAFPKALEWAANDFKTNNLSSFIITYPIRGFGRLLSLGKLSKVFTDEDLRKLQMAKTVYSVAAKYLADMQSAIQAQDTTDQWKQKYLGTIYQEFNSELVPKDLRGPQSIVHDADLFLDRLSVCVEHQQSRKSEWATHEDKLSLMRKIQVIVFWLIHQQKAHCTVQTFLNRMQHKEHIASAALDPSLTVPESELYAILLSIFAARSNTQLINADAAHVHEGLVPFKTPFGASVLRCGVEACNEPFHRGGPQDAILDIDGIRKARAEHLIKVYGIQGRFEGSNGLPERAGASKSPSSTHTNMHISVVRTWSECSREKRRAILDDESEREGFVTSVRKRICEQGRGDIFQSEINRDIREALPSFFEVLGQALRLQGENDEDITIYEHDFEQNSMEAKIRYELRAAGVLS